ncbi:MAG: NfeD family protein [Chloroflexota bacterium]|nr:NfeD family protein [Chloroflexota bacterium]
MWIAFWLVIVLLAAIGEVFTFDLFLGSVAVAALITAGVALLLPITAQASAFVALSLVGIVLVRPTLKRTLGIGSLAQEQNGANHSHLQGRQGIVTQEIDMGGGLVRLGAGEFWTARPFDSTDTLQVGEHIEVVYVDGLTALVERARTLPVNTTSGADDRAEPRQKGIS